MSAGYRDELDAALAAKESLQAQNNELQAQLNQTQHALGQAQSTLVQQQAMLQQWGVPAPAPQGVQRNTMFAPAVALALMILMAGAGAAFYILARSSTPPSTVRVESVPALTNPTPQIVPEPEQPNTGARPVPAQRAAF